MKLNRIRRIFLIMLLMIFYSSIINAQEKTNDIQSFNSVITPSAKSSHGFLTTHLIKDKLYFEIPPSLFAVDFIIALHGNSLKGDRHCRWALGEQTVQLVLPDIVSQGGVILPANPYAKSSHFDQRPAVVATFPILARGSGGSVVIEVTKLFITSIQGFIEDDNYENVISSTFIEKAVAYPSAIEIQVSKTILHPTYTTKKTLVTYTNHWSIVSLPEKPMMARLFDPRMGFFVETINEGNDPRKTGQACIVRWRLEKKDKLKELSDPINPIVFFLDPNIPKKWRPWVKAGVLAWLPAFETAGFKNAIVIKEPPVNDPEWSAHSIRHNIIKWIDRSDIRDVQYVRQMGTGGGTANHIIDKRSGEILKGDILISTPYELLTDRYFVRCAPLDPRARTLPFPEDLMGELIQMLVSHEAGHVFGMRDGNYGEFAYPAEKMRSYEWLKKMGHTPSVMTYARENYIPQPEDSIPPSLLVQQVGPADLYNIMWAYKPIPNVNSPFDELPILEQWLRIQDSVSWYRYARAEDQDGPYSTMEVVDNDDPVLSTTLGLKNLRRVLGMLPQVTLSAGSDNLMLEHMYFRVLDQWFYEMRHVVSLLGGYSVQYKSGSQSGPVYSPIERKKQHEALDFLIKEAFVPPLWLANINITRRFETEGTVSNISNIQLRVLKDLLSSDRLRRIKEIENTSLPGTSVFTMDEFLRTLRLGIWEELAQKEIIIDAYRQRLQLEFLKCIKELLSQSFPSDFKGELYANLKNLQLDIKKSISKARDNSTLGHLELSSIHINQVMKDTLLK